MSAHNLPWLDWWHAFAEEAHVGTINLGRYEAEYFSWGTGPALVCIHGLADSFLAFFPLASQLKSHFRIIAYNLPDGYRDTARLQEYSLTELTQDLIRLLNRLRIRVATLVGHSYGAAVALLAAYCFPQYIARTVSVCGFAYRPLSRWQVKLLGLGRLLPRRWACLTPYHAELRSALAPRLLATTAPAQSAYARLFRRPAKLEAPPPLRRWPRVSFRAWTHWAKELAHTDLRPILPQIHRPVLVISTDQDPLVPATCQGELLTTLPQAIGFRIRASGHFPNWTHPRVLAHAIAEFHRMTSLAAPQDGSTQASTLTTETASLNCSTLHHSCPLGQAIRPPFANYSAATDKLSTLS
ncbi:MAG: alpha/beta hydrolase [Gemmatales bacterium]|nr:alpha/beta hydrolase [Gemmatales bacterium]MDW8176428.1 alpha/beta hydrolase [Gemmatales bacterium]